MYRIINIIDKGTPLEARIVLAEHIPNTRLAFFIRDKIKEIVDPKLHTITIETE